MLQPAWYLTDGDAFADLRDAPRDHAAEAVIDAATAVFGDDAGYFTAMTAAATRLALVAAVHLEDGITHARQLHDISDIARLVAGLNLLHAYLTQTMGRLAEDTERRVNHGIVEDPQRAAALATGLARAATNTELAAGHLKEAHLLMELSTL